MTGENCKSYTNARGWNYCRLKMMGVNGCESWNKENIETPCPCSYYDGPDEMWFLRSLVALIVVVVFYLLVK